MGAAGLGAAGLGAAGLGAAGLAAAPEEAGAATPGRYGPGSPTDGGASSPADGSPYGILVGCLQTNSAGWLGAAAFPPARVLPGMKSPTGWPKLTGVVSCRNKGKPCGRNTGKTSNTPTTTACSPNEVKVVNPRRERSSSDESSEFKNMVSSCIDCGYC